MRLRTLLVDQPKRILDALETCGLRTDEDFLISTSALPDLYHRLPANSVEYSELEWIRDFVLSSNSSASGLTGEDILADSTPRLEFGLQTRCAADCPNLCTLLESVQAGGIIEIAGDKGSGKTALISNLIRAYLDDSNESIVHWIDTTGDFSAGRASRILASASSTQGAQESSSLPETSTALDRLHVSLAFTPTEAHSVIDSIRSETLSAPTKTPQASHVRAVVIDSLTPLFTPLLSSGSSEGQAMLTAFMRDLQDFAMVHGATVMVANNASLAQPCNLLSAFTNIKLKPALGSTMSFLTDATIWLSPARTIFSSVLKSDDNSNIVQGQTLAEADLSEVYIVEVLRSRSFAESKWWTFKLDSNGIVREIPSGPS